MSEDELRDYFAGQALMAVIPMQGIKDVAKKMMTLGRDESVLYSVSAEVAYQYADAMMKARFPKKDEHEPADAS